MGLVFQPRRVDGTGTREQSGTSCSALRKQAGSRVQRRPSPSNGVDVRGPLASEERARLRADPAQLTSVCVIDDVAAPVDDDGVRRYFRTRRSSREALPVVAFACALMFAGSAWTERTAAAGGTVVFSTRDGQIVLADAGGSRELLVSPTSDVEYVEPAPDGTQLAFESIDRNSLWLSDLRGRHPVLLKKVDLDEPPVWSPDSTRIAFVSNRQAWVAVARSRAVRRLGPTGIEGAFAWSPDSRHLAYAGSAGLMLYERDSGQSRLLVPASELWQAAWTPDSRQVVYWGNGGVYRFDLSDVHARPRLLVRQGRDFALSPDGRTLAFDKHFSLYLMPFDRSTRPRLLSGDFFEYAWSPDSSRLAFSRKDPRRAGVAAIYLAARTGGTPRPLLSDPGTDGFHSPSWSPDGHQIAYERIEHGEARLDVVDADGRGDHQLAVDEPDAVPDGLPVQWLPHPLSLPAAAKTVTVKPDAELLAGSWVYGTTAGPELQLATVSYPISEFETAFTALFWTPSSGTKAELHVPCEDTVASVALAGDRYAYVCEIEDVQSEFDLYVGQAGQNLPDNPLLTNGENAEAGSAAGSGDLLAAEIGDTLYRIDGTGTAVPLRHYPVTPNIAATVLAVDHDQILVATGQSSVEVIAADGTLVASLDVPNADSALLRDGRIVTIDSAGNLIVRRLDGQPTLTRPLPPGAQFEDLSGDLVLYSVRLRQHLLRLADGHDHTLRFPGQYLWAWACFNGGGINYAYNAFGPASHRLGYLTPASVNALLG